MNVTITVNGSRATVTIHDHNILPRDAKNAILNFIVDGNESVDHLKMPRELIISGHIVEMRDLFAILWDFM